MIKNPIMKMKHVNFVISVEWSLSTIQTTNPVPPKKVSKKTFKYAQFVPKKSLLKSMLPDIFLKNCLKLSKHLKTLLPVTNVITKVKNFLRLSHLY